MKNFLYILAGVAFSGLAVSCKPTLDAPAPSTADLNFSRYVAVGDYNTAGFMNGGVSRESQQTAYPAILAQQFAAASGANVAFEQPYFSSGTQMVDLTFNDAGIPVLSNTQDLVNFLLAGCGATQQVFSDQYSNSPAQTASLQNLGVPGLKIMQVRLGGLGNDANVNNTNTPSQPAAYNPYFDRMLPAGDDRTYLDVVRNSKATFFTMWIGMADVINYAMSGASCGRLPSTTEFNTEAFNLIDSLSGSGKRYGVICNIPSVKYLGLPNPLDVQRKYQQQRNDANLKIWVKALKIYNAPSAGYDTVAVTSSDFITPTGLSRLGINEQITVNGATFTLPHGLDKRNPLTESEVLDSKEADFLESRISVNKPSYNGILDTLANSKKSKFYGKVALASMQQLYGTLQNGVNYNGVVYSLTPVSGGFYSYDYFSPTPRGQAIIANKIIQTINQNFGTNIFEVNANSYPAFKHP